MSNIQILTEQIQQRFPHQIDVTQSALGELTLEISAANLLEICTALRDEPDFQFAMLIDLCGVDYLQYDVSQWETNETTTTGFSRAVDRFGREVSKLERLPKWNKPRFAVVYHLLSLTLNQRIRLRVFVEEDAPKIPSVINIWPAVNWYEREAFDLYGIVFEGHHDLRRILTDYGFVGHPFRKDFPLIGHVEMRYDAATQRCIYEPVSIQPRTLVPKVVRDDNRYTKPPAAEGAPNV